MINKFIQGIKLFRHARLRRQVESESVKVDDFLKFLSLEIEGEETVDNRLCAIEKKLGIKYPVLSRGT